MFGACFSWRQRICLPGQSCWTWNTSMANVLASFATQKEKVMDPTTSTDARFSTKPCEKESQRPVDIMRQRPLRGMQSWKRKGTPPSQNCCILLIAFIHLQSTACIVFVSELLSILCRYKCLIETETNLLTFEQRGHPSHVNFYRFSRETFSEGCPDQKKTWKTGKPRN